MHLVVDSLLCLAGRGERDSGGQLALTHGLWFVSEGGMADDGWRPLELDAALGEDAALVGVFDFAHLGDGVG
jgi:hypothetical protein